jgi:diguanylate cyclase (GGDEF)-like protein
MGKEDKELNRELMDRYISNNGKFSKGTVEYSRAFLLNLILPTILVLAVYFTIINFIILNNSMAGLITLLTFLVTAPAFVEFKKLSDLVKSCQKTIIIVYLTILSLVFSVNFQNNTLMWTGVIPVMAFALLNKKKASLVTLMFYLSLGLSYGYLNTKNEFASITNDSFINFLFASLSLVVLSYYYKYSQEKLYDVLRVNQKELKILAEIDKLTGLYNRSKIDEIVSSELAKVKDSKYDLALIIADIDDFKEINDKYGHLVGDEVIKEVAKVIKKSCKNDCVASRWGGEEFLMIMPDFDSDKAYSFAEILRQEIKNLEFNIEEKLTFSLGVTEYKPGDSAISMFKRVDDALYSGKDMGKDTTRVAN